MSHPDDDTYLYNASGFSRITQLPEDNHLLSLFQEAFAEAKLKKIVRVAIVTGANRGIGFALVKGLCKSFDGDVILTARDAEKGEEAVQTLKNEGLKPKFHQLDISDPDSVKIFKEFIQKTYGGFDILIQNAAISYGPDSTVPIPEQAERQMTVNNFGAENLVLSLLPMARAHSRIVVIASGFGLTRNIPGEELRKRFEDPQLDLKGLDALLHEYVAVAKEGKLEETGWPEWTNVISKVGLFIFIQILAKEMAKDPREDIIVNACCPGWTVTDAVRAYLDDSNLTFQGTPAKQPDEAAVDVLYLATLPPGTKDPIGKLVQYRKVLG